MRIGISTTIANGLTDGVGQYLNGLLTHLPNLSNKHSYSLFSTEDDIDIFSRQSKNICPVIVPSIVRKPVINIAWHAVAYSTLLRKSRVDIVHVPDLRRFVLGVSVPMIVTIHDMARYMVVNKYDPGRMFYHYRIQPLFLKRFDHVIVVSENTKRDVLRFFPFFEDRISVISNGLSTSLYKQLPQNVVEAVRLKLELPQHYILYVSRLEHPAKNHVKLIEAFKRLKQNTDLPHKLVLVGSPSFRSEEIYKAARSISDEIVFAGFVATEDLPAVYNAADAYIFPSLYEGFGLSVLEAMACGVPVAVSNVSSLPEVAGEAALLFNPDNSEEIAGVMKKLLTDNNVKIALCQRGREQVKKFSWEKAAQETLNVYERVYEEFYARRSI